MTWNLAKSRGLFFSATGEPPNRSFWAGEQDLWQAQGAHGPLPRAAVEWNPSHPDSRSNCLLLHDVVRGLDSLVDPTWRARTRAIYAGRSRRVKGSAASGHSPKGGML